MLIVYDGLDELRLFSMILVERLFKLLSTCTISSFLIYSWRYINIFFVLKNMDALCCSIMICWLSYDEFQFVLCHLAFGYKPRRSCFKLWVGEVGLVAMKVVFLVWTWTWQRGKKDLDVMMKLLLKRVWHILLVS